jgi:hypothetical protein
MDIHLRALDGLMAQPKGDYCRIKAVTQQLHRGAMAQDVRADSLAYQRRAGRRGGPDVLAHQVFERIAT